MYIYTYIYICTDRRIDISLRRTWLGRCVESLGSARRKHLSLSPSLSPPPRYTYIMKAYMARQIWRKSRQRSTKKANMVVSEPSPSRS